RECRSADLCPGCGGCRLGNSSFADLWEIAKTRIPHTCPSPKEESAAASRVLITDESRDDRTAPASRKGSRLHIPEPGSAQRIAHPRLHRRQPTQQQRADG